MLANHKTFGETNDAMDLSEDSPSPANGECLTSYSPTNHKHDLPTSADVSINSAVTSASTPSTIHSATTSSTPMTSSSINNIHRRNVTSSSTDDIDGGHVASFPAFPVGNNMTPSSSIYLRHVDTSSKFSVVDQPKTSSSPSALVRADDPEVSAGFCCWSHRLRRKLARVFSPQRAVEELCSFMFWHDVIVETALCMYYECLIIWISVTFNASVYKPSITHFGLYAGFFVFVCIEGWGPLCGASVNPARTWAVFLAGRMTFIKAFVYTIVEVGGAAAGTMIGYGLTPANATNQITPLLPGEGVTAVQGMAIEAILTFNLIFVGLVLGQPVGQPSAITSLTVGFCVGTGVMAAGTHTGGLQNPIVAFGPAIVSGNFKDHWLYWVGPYVGSTVATVFYLLLKVVRDNCELKPSTDAKKDEATQEGSTRL